MTTIPRPKHIFVDCHGMPISFRMADVVHENMPMTSTEACDEA